MALAAVLLLRDDTVELDPGDLPGASSTAFSRDAAAEDLLDRLDGALATSAEAQVLSLAARGDREAAEALRQLHGNVRALGIGELELRYVDDGGPAAPEHRRPGRTRWNAEVQVDWRIAGFDPAASSVEVPVTLERDGRRARFVTVAAGTAGTDTAAVTPLWLFADLEVRRGGGTLVAAVDSLRLDRYAAMARRAVRDVRAVLPQRAGRLVVEVPATQEQLTRVLGADEGAYASIAAVTATVDGSGTPPSPLHIVVNPEVFEDLGNQGAQIVLSHEAAHVATGAAFSAMPMWLLEGFADYVALAHSDVPVALAASQVIAQVRAEGAPDGLPTEAEFDPSNKALGTAYEEAWLACRLIAETHGEQRLIDLYDAVDRGTPLRAAFREHLGTAPAAFTEQWRAHLRRLAG